MKTLLMTAAAGLFSASVALAGGVQLRAEAARTPCDFKKGDVALQVTTLSCGTPKTLSLQGRAEGIVKGQRLTVPLKLRPTGAAGVYDVAAQWPAEGRWVLVFATQEFGASGSLIVNLGEGGGFASTAATEAPKGTLQIAGTELVHGKVARERIERALKG